MYHGETVFSTRKCRQCTATPLGIYHGLRTMIRVPAEPNVAPGVPEDYAYPLSVGVDLGTRHLLKEAS
jgi:hypothetical protein